MIKGDIRFSNIPVVIFSTASSPEVVKHVFESGASKFFRKPHSIAGYIKVIEEILAILKYTLEK
jgi:CheY-like chemotaxis protein